MISRFGKHRENDSSCILVFVKSPEKGKVKSRLAEAIGGEAARGIYKNFVSDILETLRRNRHPFRICFYPPGENEAVRQWLGADLIYMPQRGKDLGERMETAFRDVFSEGCSSAILIGSDIPDMPSSVLKDALESLNHVDAVVGPSFDGGYYLIGFRKETFFPEVFHGRTWSSDTVFRETKELFTRANYRVRELPELRDVDTGNDLRALLIRNRKTGGKAAATMKYLSRHKQEIFPEEWS